MTDLMKTNLINKMASDPVMVDLNLHALEAVECKAIELTNEQIKEYISIKYGVLVK